MSGTFFIKQVIQFIRVNEAHAGRNKVSLILSATRIIKSFTVYGIPNPDMAPRCSTNKILNLYNEITKKSVD